MQVHAVGGQDFAHLPLVLAFLNLIVVARHFMIKPQLPSHPSDGLKVDRRQNPARGLRHLF